jgi:hypothetical protein
MWALSVSVLVSYHLFLVWLLLTADHEVGFSMPVFSSILTHLACLAVVVVMILGRHVIPFYSILRYCIPGMAPFERDWLFKANKKKKDEPQPSVLDPATAAVYAATIGDDYEAWNQHLASRNPLSRKPGASIKEEHDAFMAARVKARAGAAAAKPPA